jgi:SAM-dependent methyltransferase
MADQEPKSDQPLSPHFRGDGLPAVTFSPVQRQARAEVDAKLANGRYRVESVDCPLCASSSRKLLSEKDSAGLPIQTSICLSCGVLYASRRLDEPSLHELYAHENLRLDRGVAAAEEFLFNNELVQGAHVEKFLEHHGLLEKLRGSMIVEIGCGPGGILAHFQRQGFAVAGFDIDPAVVEYGARVQGLDIHLGGVKRAAEIILASGRRLGLVMLEQALEHMTDPRQELERIRALMDKDTLLFIGVPGLRNIGPHYRNDLLNYLQLGHLIHFERRTLSRLLQEAGFEEIASDERIDAIYRTAGKPGKNALDGHRAARDMQSFLASAEKRRARTAAYRKLRDVIGQRVRSAAALLNGRRFSGDGKK